MNKIFKQTLNILSNNNENQDIIKYSDKLLIDMMLLLAKNKFQKYRTLFQNIAKLNFTTNETITQYIKKYLTENFDSEYLDNHYYKMLTCFDTEYSKTNLSFNEILLKPFFICSETKDKNNKKCFVFLINDNLKLFISYKAKEKNAWKDFIKNWWYKQENYKYRIECYMDIYNAFIEFENKN